MTLRECQVCHRWAGERAGSKCPDCGAPFEQGGVAVEERPAAKPKPERQVPRRSAEPPRWRGTGSGHTWEDDQKALLGSRKIAEKKRASDIVPPARNESFLASLLVLLVLAALLYFWIL